MKIGVNVEGVLLDNGIPKDYLHACLKGLQLRSFRINIFGDYADRETTLDLLMDTGIDPYIDLFFLTDENKYERSKKMEMKTQIVVEHHLHQAKHFIAGKIPVILFNTPENQGFEHRLLHRVNNWWEAFQALARLQITDRSWMR